LPRVWGIESAEEKALFLRSYVSTYLKEEIAEEQIVRKLEPFAKFLQVAAQSSGKIVNFANIAGDVGVSDHTVKTYFQILEDTLLGHLLPAFGESVRKVQGQSPKFYFFDPGVLRALLRQVDQPLTDQNYNYGNLFEHFVINELKRSAEYKMRDYQFSFFRTSNDREIDLIIDRPGHPRAVIEIKSSASLRADDVNVLRTLGAEIPNSSIYCLSRDPQRKRFGEVDAYPWQEGIAEIIR
jgi:predicted AAA+ superfamily ATPase